MDAHPDASGSVTCLVQVAEEGSRTVGIDLVNGDSYFTTGLDLSHGACRQCIFCILSNINVPLQLGAAALIDNIRRNLGVADDG